MLFTSIFGRILAYYGIYYPLYKYSKMYKNRYLASFLEFNFQTKGLNRIGLSYLFMIIINAVLFSIGAIWIVQLLLFNEEPTLLALMIAYIVVKLLGLLILKTLRYIALKIITGMKL